MDIKRLLDGGDYGLVDRARFRAGRTSLRGLLRAWTAIRPLREQIGSSVDQTWSMTGISLWRPVAVEKTWVVDKPSGNPVQVEIYPHFEGGHIFVPDEGFEPPFLEVIARRTVARYVLGRAHVWTRGDWEPVMVMPARGMARVGLYDDVTSPMQAYDFHDMVPDAQGRASAEVRLSDEDQSLFDGLEIKRMAVSLRVDGVFPDGYAVDNMMDHLTSCGSFSIIRGTGLNRAVLSAVPVYHLLIDRDRDGYDEIIRPIPGIWSAFGFELRFVRLPIGHYTISATLFLTYGDRTQGWGE